MSSTQHQLIKQCATRLRGIVEALDNIHDTSPHRWSTDLDEVHSSAESLLALINDQAPTQDAQGLAGTALRDSPASVEQAGVDERAVFEFFVRKHCGMPEHIAVNWDAKFTNDAWEGGKPAPPWRNPPSLSMKPASKSGWPTNSRARTASLFRNRYLGATMSRLTAEQARDIAREQDPAFAVDTILAGIAKAAAEGKYVYTTRDYGFGTSTYCNECDYPKLCIAILKELRGLGYVCAVRAEERQFVDLWLEVKWGEKT